MQPEVKTWTRRHFQASGGQWQVWAESDGMASLRHPPTGASLTVLKGDLQHVQSLLRELKKFWEADSAAQREAGRRKGMV